MPNLNNLSAHPTAVEQTTVSLSNDLPFAIKVMRRDPAGPWRAVAVLPGYTRSVLTAAVGETLRVRLASTDRELTAITTTSAPTTVSANRQLLRSTEGGAKKAVRFVSPVARPTLVRVDGQGNETPLRVEASRDGVLQFESTVGSIVRAGSPHGDATYFWCIVMPAGQPDIVACTFRTGSGWNVQPRAGEAVLFFDVRAKAIAENASENADPYYLVLREPAPDLAVFFEVGTATLDGSISTSSSVVKPASTAAQPESLLEHLVRHREPPAAGITASLLAARVGTGCQCAVYEQPSLAGSYCEPDDQGLLPTSTAAGSVDVQQIVAAEATSLRLLTSLSEDYMSDGSTLQSVTHYRTIVSVDDPQIQWLEIGSWDGNTKIEVNGQSLVVGPEQPARVKPSELGRVVITSDATQAGAPELRIRSSSMLEHTFVTVFPDQELHEKIANLHADTLHGSGLVPSKYSADDCTQVQTALQNISRAVVHGHTEHGAGIDSHRIIDPGQMADQHWVLRVDPKSGQLHYDGLSAQDANAINARASQIHDLDASVANSLWSHIGHAISHVVVKTTDQAKHTVSQGVDAVGHALGGAAKSAEHTAAHGAQAAGKVASQAGAAVAKDANAVGGAISDAASTIGKGLEVTLHFAEKNIPAMRFVIRQAKHVAVAISAVVNAVEVAVKDFVRWLRFLFDWKDIKRTHDLLCEETVTLLENCKSDVTKLAARTNAFFDKLRTDADKLRGASSVAVAKQHSRPSSPTHSSALEKLEWFMHLFHRHSSKASGPDTDVHSPVAELVTRVESVLKQVGQDFAHFGPDAGELVAAVKSGDMHGILAALQGFAGDMLLLACDVGQGAADAFFAVVEGVLDVFINVLRYPIKIPVLDKLYEQCMGVPLTPLSISSLLMAIPLTVGVKMATNMVPFAGEHSIALSTNRATSIAYLTGFGDIVSGMSGAWTVAKAAGADQGIQSPSSGTSKFSVAKRVFSIVLNGSKMVYYVAKSATPKQTVAADMVLTAGTLRALLQLVLLVGFANENTAKVEVAANAINGGVKVVAGIIDAAASDGLTGSILIVGGAANLLELGGYVEDPEVWGLCAVGTFLGSSAAGVLEFYRGTTLS